LENLKRLISKPRLRFSVPPQFATCGVEFEDTETEFFSFVLGLDQGKSLNWHHSKGESSLTG
jgi:hypothetical protein